MASLPPTVGAGFLQSTTNLAAASNCKNPIWFKNYCGIESEANYEFSLDEITQYE